MWDGALDAPTKSSLEEMPRTVGGERRCGRRLGTGTTEQ